MSLLIIVYQRSNILQYTYTITHRAPTILFFSAHERNTRNKLNISANNMYFFWCLFLGLDIEIDVLGVSFLVQIQIEASGCILLSTIMDMEVPDLSYSYVYKGFYLKFLSSDMNIYSLVYIYQLNFKNGYSQCILLGSDKDTIISWFIFLASGS